MEPARKRQRVSTLSEIEERRPHRNFADSYDPFYDGIREYGSDVNDIGDDEEEQREVEVGDPDADLQQTRAQLDQKLKSRFEEIFEKYGKDFTGIGDEIDLTTGEIVVDNGHLVEMVNERDAGNATSGRSMLRAFTVEPEMLESEEDDDEEDADSEDEEESQDDTPEAYDQDEINPEDMEEDDMIFFQPRLATSNKLAEKAPAHTALRRVPMGPPPLPARFRKPQQFQTPDRILPTVEQPEYTISMQLDPLMGRKIERYVSQQRDLSLSAVEPAWRTPGLAIATPGKRPIIKSILLQPDDSRPQSPGGSLWALNQPRAQRRRGPTKMAAKPLARDDVETPNNLNQKNSHDREVGTASILQRKSRTPELEGRKKRHREPFTEEDDRDIQNWAIHAKSLGLSLWSDQCWRLLTAKNPRHTYRSWRIRYIRRFVQSKKTLKRLHVSEEAVKKDQILRPRQSNRVTASSRKDAFAGKETMTEEKLSSEAEGHSGDSTEELRPRLAAKTPFTEEEDHLLKEWVSSKNFDGGNPLYWGKHFWALFEKEHPQRCWRSWSGRYRLKHWDRNALSLDQTAKGVFPLPEVMDHLSTKEPTRRSRSSSAPGSEHVRGWGERQPYTEEDDRTLLAWVSESQKAGLPVWSIPRWKQFAADNPRHGWTAWKHRYRYTFYDLAAGTSAELGMPNEPDGFNELAHFSEPEKLQKGSENSASPKLPPVQKTGKKTAYTEADDQLLLEFLADLEGKDVALWQGHSWQRFAEAHPQHSAYGWLNRGRALRVAATRESGVVCSSPQSNSRGTHRKQANNNNTQDISDLVSPANAEEESGSNLEQAPSDRSTRVRVARKFPSQISWDEAVDTLEILDPTLHAGLLADARKTREPQSVSFRPSNYRRRGQSRQSHGETSRKSASLPKTSQSPGTFRIVDASPDPHDNQPFIASSPLKTGRSNIQPSPLSSRNSNIATPQSTKTNGKGNEGEMFARNNVDPSYDFSDEEDLAPKLPQQNKTGNTPQQAETESIVDQQSATTAAIKTESIDSDNIETLNLKESTVANESILPNPAAVVGISYKQGDLIETGVLYIPEPYWRTLEDGTRAFIHPAPFTGGQRRSPNNRFSKSKTTSPAPTNGIAPVAAVLSSNSIPETLRSPPPISAASITPKATPRLDQKRTPHSVKRKEVLDSDDIDELSIDGGSSSVRSSWIDSPRRRIAKVVRRRTRERSPVLGSAEDFQMEYPDTPTRNNDITKQVQSITEPINLQEENEKEKADVIVQEQEPPMPEQNATSTAPEISIPDPPAPENLNPVLSA